jgi:hypothetical protein
VFRFPSVAEEAKSVEVTAEELSLLLWGIDPASVKRQKRYPQDTMLVNTSSDGRLHKF